MSTYAEDIGHELACEIAKDYEDDDALRIAYLTLERLSDLWKDQWFHDQELTEILCQFHSTANSILRDREKKENNEYGESS